MNNKELPPAYTRPAPAAPTAGLQNAVASPPYMAAPQPQPTPYVTSITVTPTRGGQVYVPGSCPVCGNPSWTGTYSCFAWLLCFFCFWNLGLCCCLCMRKKKCTKCGFIVN